MQAEQAGTSGTTSHGNVQTPKEDAESFSVQQETSPDTSDTKSTGGGLATDHILIDEAEEGTDTAEDKENGDHTRPQTDENEAEKEIANTKDCGEKDSDPDIGEKDTEPDIGDKDTEPDTSEKDTQPDTSEQDTQPNTSEKDTQPDTSEKDTQPDTSEKDTQPDTSEKDTRQPDTSETEKRPGFAEKKQNEEELSPLDLTSVQGNDDDLPSLSVRSNGPSVVSSDTVRESEKEFVVQGTADSSDRSVSSMNKDISVLPSTDPPKDANIGEKKTVSDKGKPVKRADEKPRVTPTTGTWTRPPSASSNSQTKSHPKDTSNTNTAAKRVRTQKGTPRTTRMTNSRQSKESGSRDSDQKFPKSSLSNASRIPRATVTPRTPMERNKKRMERTTLKKNDKPEVHSFASSSKAGVTESESNDTKDTKKDLKESSRSMIPRSDDTKDSQITGNVNRTESKTKSGLNDSKDNQFTGNVNSTESSTKPSSRLKTVNGVIHIGNEKKTVETKLLDNSPKGKEAPGNKALKEKKAPSLLNRSILKRVASVESRPEPAPLSQTNIELKSSTETNSTDGKHTSADTSSRPDKTQHKQSLTVPSTALGPVPSELDERTSIGSRKDSVRMSVDSTSRKSVDYRLHMSHIIMPPGYDDRPKSLLMHDDSIIRAAIPFLPVRLAVVCLVLNIVLPGAGTVVSGFSVLCGSQCRLSSKGDGRVMSVCVNLMVGITQLATVVFLLVGWFWSLAWGVKMVILAVEHRREKRLQREKELQTLALRAFSSPGNLRRSLLPPV